MPKIITYLGFNVNNDVKNTMEPANVELTTENVINAVQNKPLTWDSIVNATEEESHLAWRRT